MNPVPDFPPLFSGHAVAGDVSAVSHACHEVAQGRLDAGDVVWSQAEARVEFAIILRPEVEAARAAQVLPLMMVACADSLGALTPPQVGVTFDWPAGIRVNGGRVGEAALVVPDEAVAGDVPDWQVIALSLRRRFDGGIEPGRIPDETALAEEGCGELTSAQIIASICRHFLAWLNGWQDAGFRQVHQSWTFRWERAQPSNKVALYPGGPLGEILGMDEAGGLLAKSEGGTPLSVSLLDIARRYGTVD